MSVPSRGILPFRNWRESPLLAITRRQSHLLTMSGVPPTPDLQARMSGIGWFSFGLPPSPEVPGATGVRGVLTHNGHRGRWTHFLGSSKLYLVMREYGGCMASNREEHADLPLPVTPS